MKKTKLLMLGFFLFLYECLFAYIFFQQLKRVGAFGCFDDCFNFGAGYFLLQGKQLYSQIFFNHQPLMAYISAFVQYVSHPQTLFELVQYHRIIVMVLANLSGVVLIIRFGLPMFWSLLIFESTKFYIFGDRFLAEGFIVYPMIYMTVLVLQIIKKRIVYSWEYIIVAFCSWFIFWMREPFMPWGIIVYILFLWLSYRKENRRFIVFSLLVFVLLNLGMVITLPWKDYYFNAIEINLSRQVSKDAWTSANIAQIIFYPVFLLFQTGNHIFMKILSIISAMYMAGLIYQSFYKKMCKGAVLLFIFLVLANLRVVPIGKIFFAAFHMIPWYGLFISIAVFSLYEIWSYTKQKSIVYWGYTAFFLIVVLLCSPSSYLREKTDTQEEFTTNYANYYVKGEVVKWLAKPGDTLFVEMWEDPIYIVAGVPSSYTYSWYTSIMPFFPKYVSAREVMFANNPPIFYIGACRTNETDSYVLSNEDKEKYVQLLIFGKPSCLYVRDSKIPLISQEQKALIHSLGYDVPAK